MTEEKDNLRLDFLALLLHDLVTPLAVAKQFINRVKTNRYDADNPAHRKLLTITDNSLALAEKILTDIMDIAKAGNDELKACPAPASLRKILLECLEIARVYARETGNLLAFREKSRIQREIMIDEHLTTRIINNLLINAIRHSPDNETIHITAYQEAQYYCVGIANKTEELKAEDLPRLFEPYQQVKLRMAKRYRGYGLGLTFAKLATAAQKGILHAAFNDEGLVEFTLKLPSGGV